jgi:hypothetical protein
MCNKELAFSVKYYACSVSTCNRKRTALYFCSVPCWEAHLPMMRHRDAWAEEQKAPTREEWERMQSEEVEEDADAGQAKDAGGEAERKRRIVGVSAPAAAPTALPDVEEGELPRDVLVVVSKLKAYVKARSGMNTSDGVVEVLSDHLRALCTEAIRNAARDGRRTVMDRDFKPVTK